MVLACSSELESADPLLDESADAAGSGGTGADAVGGSEGDGNGGTDSGGSSGSGGAGGASGSRNAGSGGTGGVNPCSVLRHDFTIPGEPQPLLWKVIQQNGTISQQNGRLSIFPAGGGYPSKPYVQTHASVDLRECTLEVEVMSVAAGSEAQRTRLAVDWNGPAPWIGFMVQNGVLYPKNGSPQPYDASAHERWRIRSTCGSTYLETSAGGSDGTWTLQGTAVTPDAFNKAEIRLAAESDTYPGSTSVEASFEHVHAY